MRDWYRWFFERACQIWQNGENQCPIMHLQSLETRPPDLRFYPEAIWGSPANGIWFAAINPGQASSDAWAACSRSAERRACSNTVDNPVPPFDLDQYVSWHDLASVFLQDQHHPVLADSVTAAALGLLLGSDRVVCADDPDIDHDARLAAVQQLTILNMAHCKCRGYPRRSVDQQRTFWRRCGRKNLEAFLRCKPRLIVLFGDPLRNWLWDERQRVNADGPWTLEGWDFYGSGHLRHNADGWIGNLLFLPHPSTRGRLAYNPAMALHAYRLRCNELGLLVPV